MNADSARDRWENAMARQEARRREQEQTAWHGMAFRMESLCLLVFLMVSLVVLTSVFSGAYLKGAHADELLQATTLATSTAPNGAEAFAADPTEQVPETTYYASVDGALVEASANDEGAYAITREVTSEKTEGGTLYYATITVDHFGESVYTINTARYVTEGR